MRLFELIGADCGSFVTESVRLPVLGPFGSFWTGWRLAESKAGFAGPMTPGRFLLPGMVAVDFCLEAFSGKEHTGSPAGKWGETTRIWVKLNS